LEVRLTVYGDVRSGNCLKVKWLLDRLGLAYDWIEIDVMSGVTRSARFLALNPAGQIPLVVFADGRKLAQSNALLIYFAEGTDLIPNDSFDRARMLEWMFWEQYSHEPYVAVARFQLIYQGRPRAEIEPRLFERGEAALDRLEAALEGASYLVGDQLSLADIALIAYTRVAHEGGFDLFGRPALRAWIDRVEADLGIR
jgi:glutathione S-transferase